MPDGWCGALVTDSRNVLDRLGYLRSHLGLPASQVIVPRNLPWQWYRRMVTSLLRLGELQFRHVKGHPTAADLKRGYTVGADGARKYDVSDQQVWCDQEAQRQAVKARLSRGGQINLEKLRRQRALV